MIQIKDAEFLELTQFMQKKYGINLANKKQLIEGRMSSHLEKKGLKSFSEYIKIIKMNNMEETTTLINKLTTNHTFFYREDNHYKFLREEILANKILENKSKTFEIWSAGCSSGEEAYTASMAVEDYLGFKRNMWRFKIYATDISQNVLEKAKKAVYSEESVKTLPDAWKKRFLTKVEKEYQLVPQIKNNVEFSVFNLMDPIPFGYKNKFDLVFCRNVMIYFDQKTKTDLVERFYDAVKPGGYLFIGHSETVQKDATRFKYIRPAIYKKVI